MKGKNLYEVIVKHTVTILELVPVSADNKKQARDRATRIVKAGNAKAVGGRTTFPETEYNVCSVTRLGGTP